MFAAEQETFVPRHLDGSLHDPQADDAYVRVRLPESTLVVGVVTVYLCDGTALMVPAGDLLRLAPADD